MGLSYFMFFSFLYKFMGNRYKPISYLNLAQKNNNNYYWSMNTGPIYELSPAEGGGHQCLFPPNTFGLYSRYVLLKQSIYRTFI